MSKENAIPIVPQISRGEISEEQKARISLNFRAAKALLARKRPRLEACTHHQSPSHKIVDANGIATPVRVTSIKRVPLAELPTNTPSPSFVMGVKLKGCENSSSSFSGGLTINRTELIDHGSRASRIVVPLENDHILDSFKTPLKQPECSTLIDSVSMPSILDDDFDESILEEIDAFCDQKSAEKAERQVPSGEIFVGSQQTSNSSGVLSTTSEGVKSEGTLDSGGHLDSKANGSGSSQTVQTGNMPEEYLKYLQSLNDRQREASCYDISVPLMIVAGPGSGKTSTMVGRVFMLLNEGISPSNILAMTFTTAAASEMRDRIGAVAGKAIAKELPISTFHSFSLQLCRSHAEKYVHSEIV
ncbi:hypothetical protein SLA2020_285070 [Shorea laevis]